MYNEYTTDFNLEQVDKFVILIQYRRQSLILLKLEELQGPDILG